MKVEPGALKAGLWAILTANIFFAINFFCQMLLARRVSPHDFGLFVLAVAGFELLGLAMNFGLQFSYVSSTGSQKDFDDHWLLVNILGILAVALGVCIVLVQRAFGVPGGIWVVVAILLASTWPRNLGELYLSPMRREMKFRLPAVIAGSSSSFGILCAVVLAYLGFGYWSLVAREVIGTFVLLGAAMIFGGIKFGKSHSWTTARGYLRFGFELMVSRAAEVLFNRGPLVIFELFFGKVSLGNLFQANYLSELLNRLLAPLTETVAYSASARTARAGEAEDGSVGLFLFLVILVTFPLSLIVCLWGPEIFHIVFGPQWKLGGLLFRHSGLILLLLPLFFILKSAVNALGNPRRVTYCYLICALIWTGSMWMGHTFGRIEIVPWGMGVGFTVSLLVLFASVRGRISLESSRKLLFATTLGYLLCAAIAPALSSHFMRAVLFVIAVGLFLAGNRFALTKLVGMASRSIRRRYSWRQAA